MKNLVRFAEQAKAIVAAAHDKYAFAEGVKNAFVAVQASLIGYAAGTDALVVLGVVPSGDSQFAWQAVKVSLTCPTTLTGATATALTVSVGYSRAGAAVVPIASLVFSTGVNATAEVETFLTLVAAALSLQAGDVLMMTTTHASTGTALPASSILKVELQ